MRSQGRTKLVCHVSDLFVGIYHGFRSKFFDTGRLHPEKLTFSDGDLVGEVVVGITNDFVEGCRVGAGFVESLVFEFGPNTMRRIVADGNGQHLRIAFWEEEFDQRSDPFDIKQNGHLESYATKRLLLVLPSSQLCCLARNLKVACAYQKIQSDEDDFEW